MTTIACFSCHGNLAGTVPGTSGTYVGQAYTGGLADGTGLPDVPPAQPQVHNHS